MLFSLGNKKYRGLRQRTVIHKVCLLPVKALLGAETIFRLGFSRRGP
jgi:hypothetical protein